MEDNLTVDSNDQELAEFDIPREDLLRYLDEGEPAKLVSRPAAKPIDIAGPKRLTISGKFARPTNPAGRPISMTG